MNNTTNATKAAVIEYCTLIGSNSLLVQGPGGNVSWKDGETLWIKASGTWLIEAAEKDIFVGVDLPHLNAAIKNGDYSTNPRMHGESMLKPSIETHLHALMPHRVVVHLHAIEILAHLVRDDCKSTFNSLIDTTIHWTLLDYHKPGPALAAAVSVAIVQNPNVDVIFLKNHGVVIGGTDVTKVNHILKLLTTALSTAPISICYEQLPKLPIILSEFDQYFPSQDINVNQLALNTDLFNQLDIHWALYPDHVVFLGTEAYVYKSWDDFRKKHKHKVGEQPELVFVHEKGVFFKPTFSKAKLAQLRCYYDVLIRQRSYSTIRVLTPSQIAELVNWDAEKYRMNLAK